MQLQFLHKTALNSFAFSVFSYTLQAESTAVSFPPPLSKSLRGRPPAAAAAYFLALSQDLSHVSSQRQKRPLDVKATAYIAQTIIIFLRKQFQPDHESHNLLLRRRPSRGRPRGRHLQHNEVDPRVDRVQAGLPGGMRAQARGAKADQKKIILSTSANCAPRIRETVLQDRVSSKLKTIRLSCAASWESFGDNF